MAWPGLSSGLRVMMSTVPLSEPSLRSAGASLMTSSRLISSAGKSDSGP